MNGGVPDLCILLLNYMRLIFLRLYMGRSSLIIVASENLYDGININCYSRSAY